MKKLTIIINDDNELLISASKISVDDMIIIISELIGGLSANIGVKPSELISFLMIDELTNKVN